jgi:peptidyl-prolyl cis-trans isomerase A (cyclophilin A)
MPYVFSSTRLLLPLRAAMLSAVCFGGATVLSQTPPVTAPAALPDAPSTTAHELPPAEPTGPTVLFDTTMGRLQCKLFDKESPLAVANFVGLANGTKPFQDPTTGQQVTGKRFYDGTTFHRVIPGFMIQGGDPLGTGEGGPGYQFDNENSAALRFDVPGRLAMANAGPNTNGSQFFITEAPQNVLNGGYTIFGQCDDHTVNLVGAIARVDRNANDKPLTPVTIRKVTIIPAGQPVPPDPAAVPPPVAAPPPPGSPLVRPPATPGSVPHP